MDKPTVAIITAVSTFALTLCGMAIAFPGGKPNPPPTNPNPTGIYTVENIFRGDAYLCHWVPGEPEGKPDILITQPE
jgi:hypothetical protein